MLKITLCDGSQELRLKLEGKLSGPWVGELRQCWRTASSILKGRATVVDLGEVDFVDPEGQALLAEMHHEGVRLLAVTPIIRELVEEVLRASRYATVEEKPAPKPHAIAFSDAAGRDPRPL